jgi:hypothetical protein
MLMVEKLEPLLSAFVAQLRRPSLAAAGELGISYIFFDALTAYCASSCQLGDDHRIMRTIARCPC